METNWQDVILPEIICGGANNTFRPLCVFVCLIKALWRDLFEECFSISED